MIRFFDKIQMKFLQNGDGWVVPLRAGRFVWNAEAGTEAVAEAPDFKFNSRDDVMSALEGIVPSSFLPRFKDSLDSVFANFDSLSNGEVNPTSVTGAVTPVYMALTNQPGVDQTKIVSFIEALKAFLINSEHNRETATLVEDTSDQLAALMENLGPNSTLAEALEATGHNPENNEPENSKTGERLLADLEKPPSETPSRGAIEVTGTVAKLPETLATVEADIAAQFGPSALRGFNPEQFA